MTDTVLIHFSWDSGPHGVWQESNRSEPYLAPPASARVGSEDCHLPIPAAIWERYQRADAELRAAEDALDLAGQEARKELEQTA